MKLNLLKFLLLTIVVSLTGCLGDDVDIENNRRLLIKGKITDTQGNALPNISVITSSFGDALGQTTTDTAGNFRLVSLDEQFDPLDIFINANDFNNPNINEDYESRRYLSPQHTNRVLYELGTITLGKVATLFISLNNITGDQNSLNYEIKFTPSVCELPLNVLTPPNNCDLAEAISGNLTPSSENQIVSLYSIQGSNVTFEYSLNGDPLQTIEIPLNDEDNNYVFEY